MSLSTAIAAALDARPDSGVLPCDVSAESGPYRLSLALTSTSPVGVALDHLEFNVTRPDRPEWSLDELKSWGDRLAARVTYLMEPLVVVEADAQGVAVDLRSKAPTARGDLRSYYEARLWKTGTLRLNRITFDAHDRRRSNTSFQLSREVVERLADDLVASVESN